MGIDLEVAAPDPEEEEDGRPEQFQGPIKSLKRGQDLLRMLLGNRYRHLRRLVGLWRRARSKRGDPRRPRLNSRRRLPTSTFPSSISLAWRIKYEIK